MYKEEDLLETIKDCVGEVIDREGTPGLMLMFALMFSFNVTKKMKFSKEVEIPNFESIIDSPDSEEARFAAGFIRTSALSIVSFFKVDSSWAQEFWNRGMKISPCEFSQEGSTSDK